MAASRLCLLGFVFRADHDAVSTGSTNVVTHGGSQIERRNPVGRADLDDPAGIRGAAELVAEFSLVSIERV